MVLTSFTAENLKILEQAIAEGAKRVKYSDKEIEYRTLEEMLQTRDLIKKELGLNKCSTRKTGLFGGTRIQAIHSKGLD